MNKSAMLICIIISLLLFGCVSAPESLQKSETAQTAGVSLTDSSAGEALTDKKGAVSEAVAVSPKERGDISVIREQLEIDLQKTYKNISVERARAGNGSIMPTYDVTVGVNEDYDLNPLLEYLFSDKWDITDEKNLQHKDYGEPIDANYPATWEPTMREDGRLLNANASPYSVKGFAPIRDKDVMLSTYINGTGAIWGSPCGATAEGDIYLYQAFESVEQYDLFFETPDSDLSYKMYNGEEWNVLEAIKFAEDFFSTYIAPTDPQKYTYSAKTLFVKKLENNNYGYLFQMQKQDENGNYYDVDQLYARDNDAIESGKEYMIDGNIIFWCVEKEKVARFVKGYSFSFGEETDPGDNLLTLGAASEILSEKLAQNISLKLVAELNYVFVCKSYPYYQTWEYPLYYEDMALTTCEVAVRPYWCFRPTVLPAKYGFSEIYFVDAVTGEVVTMNNGRVQRR